MSNVAMSCASNGAREKTRRNDFRYVSDPLIIRLSVVRVLLVRQE